MLKNWGLTAYDTDKIISLEDGRYILKADKDRYKEMLLRHKRDIEFYIAHDKKGTGFIYDMFLYELANHNFCVTCDLTDTIEALGLSALFSRAFSALYISYTVRQTVLFSSLFAPL